MNQNAPRGCAARGNEVYAEHTARARKCATSAHFICEKPVLMRVPGSWRTVLTKNEKENTLCQRQSFKKLFLQF